MRHEKLLVNKEQIDRESFSEILKRVTTMSEWTRRCIRGMAQTQPTIPQPKYQSARSRRSRIRVRVPSVPRSSIKKPGKQTGLSVRRPGRWQCGRAGVRGGAAWAERVFYYSRADAGVPAAFRYAQHDRLANKEL